MSTTPTLQRAARPVPADDTTAPAWTGKLDWRVLLGWLRDDGVVSADEAERLTRRFGAGASSQHALVRLGAAGLQRAGSAQPLDTEALTEWLARRCRMPYLRIDPLKADVGRVADVMSVHYAESRCALPLQLNSAEVVIATSEPFDLGWIAEIEAHTRRSVKLVLANPQDVRKYTTEFYALAKSVRAAQKTGEVSPAASFEQLVELGKTAKQLDANDQGVVQVVDWLWQYAFDQRASDIHLEPRQRYFRR